jgi:hypothetical protein
LDLALYAAIVVSFAALVTAHAALVFGLARRTPHWRGPVGLVLAPLAPYWGFKAGLRVRSVLWLFALAAYVTALWLAR